MKGGKSKPESNIKKISMANGARKASKRSTAKPAKDPNKPKRALSSFLIFMEKFREQYKKEHPNNKSVAAVAKAGGEKWKSMSDAEKKPHVKECEKRKKEHEKKQAVDNGKVTSKNGEDSEKSMSEVNDDDKGEQLSAEEDED